jgi:phage head maturation protease
MKLDVSKESLARHVAAISTDEGQTRAQAFKTGKRPKLSPLPEKTLRKLAYSKGVPKEGSGIVGAWEPEHAQRVILVPWTDESIDSYNTVFDSRGWDTRAFEQNPMIFSNHDRNQPVPIGLALKLEDADLRGVDGVLRRGSVAHVLLSPEELEPTAEVVYRNWMAGRINGSSHSFEPIDASYAEGKDVQRFRIPKDAKLDSLLVFRKQRLQEISIVTLPANSSTTSRSEHVADVAATGLLTREDAGLIYSAEDLEGLDFPEERGDMSGYLDEVVLTPEFDSSEYETRLAGLEATVATLLAEKESRQLEAVDGSRKADALDGYSQNLILGMKAKAKALEIETSI